MALDHRVSFVPRFVRELVGATSATEPTDVGVDDAVVLFADITGSTDLAERLAELGPGGVEEMASRINAFLGLMIDAIEACGGDITGFAGDALVASWPERGDGRAVAAAVEAAVRIQSSVVADGSEERLSARVGVGRGPLRCLVLGGLDDRWHSLATGDALADAGRANDRSEPDAVVVSPAVAGSSGFGRDGHDVGAGYLRVALPDTPPGQLTDLELLRPEAAAEELGRLDGFVPLPALVHLEAGHGDWLPELRPVTVVFASIADFDATLPVGVAQRIILEAQSAASSVEANLTKISVDDKGVALLAVMGMPPRSHEDDPRRGVLLAEKFVAAADAAGVRIHVGVTTGRVFCGAIGNERRREYTLIGSTVNRAARLMTHARSIDADRQVLTDQATAGAVGAAVLLAPLPEVKLKGLSAMTPYRLLDATPATAAAETPASGDPLIGRTLEMSRLHDAIDGDGMGAPPLVIIEGEAGIGKSTLADAALALATSAGYDVVATAGDSVEQTSPYWAITPLFHRLLGVSGGDPASQRAAVAERLGPALAGQAALLNDVLPVEFEPTETTMTLPADTGPAIVQSLVTDALIRLVEAHRTLLYLSDFHWFDASSASVVAALAERGACGLVVAARPHGATAADLEILSKQERATHLVLGPLARAETEQVIAAVADAVDADPSVVDVVVERSGGHPLFTIELVRSMLRQDLLDVSDGTVVARARVNLEQASFPSSVEGLIGQRIDRLPVREQLTLRAASVVGAEFGMDALSAIHPSRSDSATIHEHLALLEHEGFIRRDEAGWRFGHRLTCDVAYDRILFAQRAGLHAALAEFFTSAADAGDLTGRLAHHWEQSWLAAREVEQPPVDVGYVTMRAADALEQATDAALAAGVPHASLDLGLRALRVLGVELPTDPALVGPAIGAAMERIGALAGANEPSALLDLPPLDDPAIDRAVMLTLRLQPSANMAQDRDLFALLALTNYLSVLEHGLGIGAPGAIAVFGSLELLMTGAAAQAHARTTIALEVARRQGGMLLSYTAFVHSWLVNHWYGPPADVVALTREASGVGFESGDLLFGSFNAAAHVVTLALSGAPLDEVVAAADECHEIIEGRVHSAGFHCRHERQFAQALAGRTTGPQSFTDDRFDDDADVASILQTRSPNQIAIYLASRVRLSCLYRDYAAAVSLAAQVAPVREAMAGQLHDAEFVFHATVAQRFRAAEVDGDERARLRSLADAGVAQLEQWADACPGNYASKLALVWAVDAWLSGEHDRAHAAFEQSASLAAEHGFVHDEAFAHELAAALHREIGDVAAMATSANASSEAYARWGAHAKVDDVRARFSA